MSNLTDIGKCPYCKQPVFAAPGQSILWVTRTQMFAAEKVGKPKSSPTHKKCRKARR